MKSFTKELAAANREMEKTIRLNEQLKLLTSEESMTSDLWKKVFPERIERKGQRKASSTKEGIKSIIEEIKKQTETLKKSQEILKSGKEKEEYSWTQYPSMEQESSFIENLSPLTHWMKCNLVPIIFWVSVVFAGIFFPKTKEEPKAKEPAAILSSKEHLIEKCKNRCIEHRYGEKCILDCPNHFSPKKKNPFLKDEE